MSAVESEKHKKALQEDVEKETHPLTENEQKTLQAMRQELSDLIKPDTPMTTLIRFIRGYATETDPTRAAIERLKECLEWRASAAILADSILERKLEGDMKFRENWPVGVHGCDKMGRPVYVERVGMINPDILEQNFTIEQMILFHVQVMERLNHCKEDLTRRLGKTMYKHVVVIDLEGFGTKHLGKGTTTPLKTMVHIDQHYYPESLYKMIIVNAPFVFRMGWAIVKPLLHPLTRDRIKMGNEYLKDYIDDEQIPHFLGGKCKCEGGKCLFVPFKDGKSEQ